MNKRGLLALWLCGGCVTAMAAPGLRGTARAPTVVLLPEPEATLRAVAVREGQVVIVLQEDARWTRLRFDGIATQGKSTWTHAAGSDARAGLDEAGRVWVQDSDGGVVFWESGVEAEVPSVVAGPSWTAEEVRIGNHSGPAPCAPSDVTAAGDGDDAILLGVCEGKPVLVRAHGGELLSGPLKDLESSEPVERVFAWKDDLSSGVVVAVWGGEELRVASLPTAALVPWRTRSVWVPGAEGRLSVPEPTLTEGAITPDVVTPVLTGALDTLHGVVGVGLNVSIVADRAGGDRVLFVSPWRPRPAP